MSKRSAPRRKVVDYWKSGEYGSVAWYIKLDCDHVELRKRKPPSGSVGCLQCAGEKAPPVPDGVVFDPVVQMQTTDQRLKRLLAKRLGVSEDSITIIFDAYLEAAGAKVHLDLAEVQTLLR